MLARTRTYAGVRKPLLFAPSWARPPPTALPTRPKSAAASAAPSAATPLAQARALFRRHLGVRVAVYGTGAAVVVTGALYAWSVFSKDPALPRMLSIFEAGGRHGWEVPYDDDSNEDVARPALVAQIAEVLQPKAMRMRSPYVIIFGETGTGKSTAVRQAIRGLPWPKGVVYFDTPLTTTEFSVRLSWAVGFWPAETGPVNMRSWRVSGADEAGVGRFPFNEPLRTWSKGRYALQDAAIAYYAKHGRPMTLVIDGADLLAKNDPIFFLQLQGYAKTCVDGGYMSIVFVLSEGSSLELLKSSSAYERASSVAVGDISDADAVAYLARCGVPLERAEDAVSNITGGRLWLLRQLVCVHTRESNEQFRRPFDYSTDDALQQLGLAKDHKLFRRLVENGRSLGVEAMDLMDIHLLLALVNKKVLTRHKSGQFSFQARHVETFFRNAIAHADRRTG